MNTIQLECFLAVAENLSFARAAEQLHVTQPAVTQQIHALEKELNVKLFVRTTRIVRLTEEGKAFLPDARQIVAVSERAVKRFENRYEGGIQVLSVGCDGLPGLFLLSDALRKLAREYPAVHPRLQVIPFRHIYRLLEEGDLDVIVGFKAVESMRISAVYREAAKVPQVCVCPPDSPLLEKESVTLEDLKHERLVLLTPVEASAQVVQTQGQLMDGRPPSEFYFCDSGEAIATLVSGGYGIAVLPDLFASGAFPLAKIPVKGVPPISFGVYYKSIQGNPLLKEFVRMVREVFAELYPPEGGQPPADQL